MPLLSSFHGILIYIYQEKGAAHKTPHVHAWYGGEELTIDFDANVLAGELPRKQTAYVTAWVLMHQDELQASWKAYMDSGELIKIEGLK